MPLCGSGEEWNWSEGRCVPKGTAITGYIEGRREKGLITPAADLADINRAAEKNTPLADLMGYNNPDIKPVEEEEPPPYKEPEPEPEKEPEKWTPSYIYPGNQTITQPAPTNLYPGQEALNTELATLLSREGQDDAEQAMWDTTMARMNEEYEKAKEQLNEDLNVKGLYYSGIRAEKMQELADDYNKVVAETQAQFNYERFNRDLQRNQQAINYALGAKGQEIQWALGQGQLSLGQLDLALQESIGMNTLALQNAGMLNDFAIDLAYVAISEAKTDLERQTVWANIVQVLYQMGLSENDINAIWLGVSGQQNNPPV